MIAIVGGGITGLAAAHRLTERLGPGRCLVLEADAEPGGKIRTRHIGNVTVEDGPDAFLTAKPHAVDFCRALGLADRLIPLAPAAQRAFVRRGPRLYPLPAGLSGHGRARLWPLMSSGLLSPGGRLRAALEVVQPRRADQGEESVAGFVIRRFGLEVWERVAEPLLAGISAGDGTTLSLRAAMPRLAELERTRRSILLAGFRATAPSGPNGFRTLAGGLGEMIVAGVARLGPGIVRCGVRVDAIGRVTEGWRLATAQGETIRADAVLVAAPARSAAAMLRAFDAPLAQSLTTIPFASSAVVTLGWPRAGTGPLPDGSGWLVPHSEGGAVIAVSLTSVKFPHRAPADTLLLRVFFGRDAGLATRDDAWLAAAAEAEAARVLTLPGRPTLTRVARWADALPQYVLGHQQRVRDIERLTARHAGLALAGASYRGVGIGDCIADGFAAADRLAVP